jgi:hypothetical protein
VSVLRPVRQQFALVLVFVLVLFELELVKGLWVVELGVALKRVFVRLQGVVFVRVFFVEVAHVAQSSGFGGRFWCREPKNSAALVLVEHLVDQPVLDGLIGLEEAIALHVDVNLLDRLTGVVRVDLVDPLADVEDLARVDLDVR